MVVVNSNNVDFINKFKNSGDKNTDMMTEISPVDQSNSSNVKSKLNLWEQRSSNGVAKVKTCNSSRTPSLPSPDEEMKTVAEKIRQKVRERMLANGVQLEETTTETTPTYQVKLQNKGLFSAEPVASSAAPKNSLPIFSFGNLTSQQHRKIITNVKSVEDSSWIKADKLEETEVKPSNNFSFKPSYLVTKEQVPSNAKSNSKIVEQEGLYVNVVKDKPPLPPKLKPKAVLKNEFPENIEEVKEQKSVDFPLLDDKALGLSSFSNPDTKSSESDEETEQYNYALENSIHNYEVIKDDITNSIELGFKKLANVIRKKGNESQDLEENRTKEPKKIAKVKKEEIKTKPTKRKSSNVKDTENKNRKVVPKLSKEIKIEDSKSPSNIKISKSTSTTKPHVKSSKQKMKSTKSVENNWKMERKIDKSVEPISKSVTKKTLKSKVKSDYPSLTLQKAKSKKYNQAKKNATKMTLKRRRKKHNSRKIYWYDAANNEKSFRNNYLNDAINAELLHKMWQQQFVNEQQLQLIYQRDLFNYHNMLHQSTRGIQPLRSRKRTMARAGINQSGNYMLKHKVANTGIYRNANQQDYKRRKRQIRRKEGSRKRNIINIKKNDVIYVDEPDYSIDEDSDHNKNKTDSKSLLETEKSDTKSPSDTYVPIYAVIVHSDKKNKNKIEEVGCSKSNDSNVKVKNPNERQTKVTFNPKENADEVDKKIKTAPQISETPKKLKGRFGSQLSASNDPVDILKWKYRRYKHHVETPMRGRRSPRSSVEGVPGAVDRGGDDASSVSSESYSRDVAILNCCFDDIERFIARLQHTAAATRELKRRQQSRKIKKNSIGDGLLSMRAKRPSPSEFEEILQKFKLSFNMLGKLRTYIHEPNAPELVHFLFTPLALIVDASRDDQPPPDTPAKVLSPLLTREAIDLLTNCLSSRETELWQSLGDPWTVPKEVWKYPVPPYQPVFSSGWAPELPEEGRDSRPESHKHHRQDMDDHYKRGSHSPGRYPRNPYPESDGSVSESGPEGPSGGPGTSMQWLNELRGRGARVVQVIYPRTANNEKELTVVRGEYLEVVDDSRKWWKCGNSRGVVAHVPHTIVTPYAPEGPQEGMRPGGADWVRQERQGKKDQSSTISEPSSSPPPPKLPSRREATPTPIPEPPPMPPPDFTPGNTLADRNPKKKIPLHSKQLFGTTKQTGDLVNYEMKTVLEAFRKRKPHIDVQKTPNVYVDNRATPKEVQHWLKKKNFSDRVCKQFDGVDGAKLFSLSKKQLKSFCGPEEGTRLYSQITIQRNFSGYKTANTGELKRILQEQRKKTETDDAANVDKQFSFLDNQQNDDTSSEEEVIVVRKSKKSKEKKSSKRRSVKEDSPSKSRSKSAHAKPSTSNVPVSPPKSSSSGIKHKPSQAKGAANTGTLKEQIKKQRMKIIYKTDDEETMR